MSFHSLCNATCDLQSPDITASATGRQKSAWTTAYSNLRCSIQPASGNVRMGPGAEQMVITHHVYIPRVIRGITAKWRLLSGGVYYEIVSAGDMAGRGLGMKLEVREVSPV